MAPNGKWNPDPNKKHLPSCSNCHKRKKPCLEGPGKNCYECWKSPDGACRDYDPEVDEQSSSSEDEPIKAAASKRPLFEKSDSDSVEVRVTSGKRYKVTPAVAARAPLVPSRPVANNSYDFLFGQQNLSGNWLNERRNIKDMIAGLMASIRPRGDRDMLDWLAVGRAIGDAVEAATAEPAEDSDESAQDQADKAEAGGSGSKDIA